MIRILVLMIVSLSASSVAIADDAWLVWLGRAHSFKMLGSEDARRGFYFGLEQSKAEPRFHFWGHDGELVREVYYLKSDGGGFRVWPETTAHNYGVTVAGRFWQKGGSATGLYVEVGWGIDYINRLTYDVYTRINSSPVLGFGVSFEVGGRETLVGLRWKHISNAGSAGPNEGENYFLLLVGVRL